MFAMLKLAKSKEKRKFNHFLNLPPLISLPPISTKIYPIEREYLRSVCGDITNSKRATEKGS
jgi:hypothetical protein